MISKHREFHVVGNLPLWLYLYFISFEIIAVNTALYDVSFCLSRVWYFEDL